MKYFIIISCLFACCTQSFAQSNIKHGTGLSFNDGQYRLTLKKATLVRSLYKLPSNASLKKWCPLPKSQGQYGTCVGWSSAYYALTIIEAEKNNVTDKSEINNSAFSPVFVYFQIKSKSDDNCQSGTYLNDALNVLKDKGAVKYNDFNSECPKSIPDNLFIEASNYRLKSFAKLFDINDNPNDKISIIKKNLSEGNPVVIGMEIPPSFDNAKLCWHPAEDPGGTYAGHAMCVIGYDDKLYGGAFELANSWGTDWGNDGFIWVNYKDFSNFCKYAFELIAPLNSNQEVNKESSLSGKVKFVSPDGIEMKASLTGDVFKMNNEYKSGTRFRLHISNDEPAFVYAFGSDLTGRTYKIFPYSPGISPALTYKQNEVALPDEDHLIEMDNNTGTDFLCVIYSLNPLNVEKIMNDVQNQHEGSFRSKVMASISADMINIKDINYLTDGEIGFTAKSKDRTAVALIVETTHIP